jgi:hypothetical protein
LKLLVSGKNFVIHSCVRRWSSTCFYESSTCGPEHHSHQQEARLLTVEETSDFDIRAHDCCNCNIVSLSPIPIENVSAASISRLLRTDLYLFDSLEHGQVAHVALQGRYGAKALSHVLCSLQPWPTLACRELDICQHDLILERCEKHASADPMILLIACVKSFWALQGQHLNINKIRVILHPQFFPTNIRSFLRAVGFQI